MGVEIIMKQPGEVLPRAVRFAGLTALASVNVVSVEARGLMPGAPMLLGTAALDGNAVAVTLSGGGDGERYLVTVRASDEGGAEAEAELDVSVIEGAWAMPDGGTGYLSIAEFVKNVGLSEVIALTDGTGEGRIDRDLIVSRLTNAQAVVDTYLASRYVVPLSEAPLIVKKIVTDLALAALYPRGAPDGIADQAKASTRLLERIQAGQAQIPAAVPPAPAVSENPVVIAPGRRAYPDGLAYYR